MPELAHHPEPATPPATSQPGSAPTRPGTPALPAFNPGRSAITPPGTIPSGKPVRLADIRRNK